MRDRIINMVEQLTIREKEVKTKYGTEKFNDMVIGRELKMVEQKNQTMN
jgi:hypothetical protein